MRAEISVIIPQFGLSQMTVDCVTSLLNHHSQAVEVIVVDDGSDKADVRALQDCQFQNVELILNSINRGVTVSWNQGSLAASGKYFIFLNNDVQTTGTWCFQLVEPLQNGRSLLAGLSVRRERFFPKDMLSIHPSSMLLEGWCLAVSRETFFELNLFDDRFRLYFSDTDFQLRILQEYASNENRLSAFNVQPFEVVEGLSVKHLGHRTTREQSNRLLQWRNDRQEFFKKWNISQESHEASSSL